MRPLRLLLDGFGSYREPADVDFSGVEFFALVGPTGSGKSTVIDGLCFALYGTVPRWGKENVIAQALAPAANACRVCLVFEAAGQRYGVVRALTRDKKGLVHTKEARLERLDSQLPGSAPLPDLLAATVEALAEGPDEVKSKVQEILGLTYEHFTQSVLLPQGRFSEFLHAKPADRQGLLVELLAYGVYESVGQQARRRAEVARERLRVAESARQGLADASEQAEKRAAQRVQALTALARAAEEKLAVIGKIAAEAEMAAQQAQAAASEAAVLAGMRTPADVPRLVGQDQRRRQACRGPSGRSGSGGPRRVGSAAGEAGNLATWPAPSGCEMPMRACARSKPRRKTGRSGAGGALSRGGAARG